jgi:putative flippase GtrA
MIQGGLLRSLTRSVLVSLVTLAAEFALLPILHRLLGMPNASCYAAVQLVGTSITFGLGRHWAFEAARPGTLRAQSVRYVAVFAGSFVLNTLLPSIGSYVLHFPPVPSFAASQAIVYVGWNYPLNRWWVFREGLRPALDA